MNFRTIICLAGLLLAGCCQPAPSPPGSAPAAVTNAAEPVFIPFATDEKTGHYILKP